MVARQGSDTTKEAITGVAGGVPFLAVPPDGGPRDSAPIVVAWHLMDPPRTEAAFASALPLTGLDAWRIYLGLPLSGSRMPAGGDEELMRLGYEDAVLNLHGPVTDQAAGEFEATLAEIRDRLDVGHGPLGVVGGSVGSAVALLVLAEGRAEIGAAVLVSPLVRLRSAVEAMERRFGIVYAWSDRSRAVARRLDFVVRAEQIARRQHDPAVLLVVGEDDDVSGFRDPATELRDALAQRYADPERAELVLVPNMGHALAEEPGVQPAPQTAHAAEVDGHATRWLRRHLGVR
jgi:alpha-beta hydrolase superfamily lysophospholipase